MTSFNKQKIFFFILGLTVLSLCSYIIGYQIGFKSWGKQISISLDPALPVRGLASAEEAVDRSIASVSREEYANPQNLFDKAKVLESTSSDIISTDNTLSAEGAIIVKKDTTAADNALPTQDAIPTNNVIPTQDTIPTNNIIPTQDTIPANNVIPAKAGIQNDDDILFVTGNLLYTDEKGNTSFVCNSFSQVQFVFSAFGIAIRGEQVIMKLTANCKSNEDPQYIGPFTLPAKKILESSIVKSKFNEGDSEIEFENVSLFWPKSWVLIRADFKKEGINDFSVIAEQPETEEDIFVIEF